jgi:acyl-CoA dehydrogenase
MGWNTLGMRGTCSAGFDLHATGVAEQIMPEAYSSIHAASMVPAAHLMWSSVWAGIAAGAVEKARLYTRKAARANGGQMPPGAVHFSRASAQLRQLNALICNNLSRFEAIADDHAALQQPDFQTTIGLLKVESSELAVTTVMSAMRACGLAGYRNDGEVSIGRALRDILSSPIMINNERIMANLATSTLLTPTPASLRA